MTQIADDYDPDLDLVFERTVELRPEQIWAAWTQPEHVVHWFTPAPWKTLSCDIELRPGGIFRTVMCSPDGEQHPHVGCFLEVTENRRLVWTDALAPGYGPAATPFITAYITLEPDGSGTRYHARARHKNSEDMLRHVDMGFEHGWGLALDQMVAYMKAL